MNDADDTNATSLEDDIGGSQLAKHDRILGKRRAGVSVVAHATVATIE